MSTEAPRLRKLAVGLWVVDAKFTLRKGFLPVAIPRWLGQCSTRMTVVRLTDGSLFLHSPVPLEESLLREIATLGPVQHVVGPNVMHNEFLLDWFRAFPSAHHWIAPKAARRNPALVGYRELSDANPVSAENFEQRLMEGHRNYETVFLHRSSRTLLVTDLAYGLCGNADPAERFFLRLAGVRRPLGLTSYSRNKVTDALKFRANLERVLRWDFDRLTLCHGDVLSSGGKEAFRRIWAGVLQEGVSPPLGPKSRG